MSTTPAETSLIVPFFKGIAIPLGWFYVVLTFFVIVGSSNAVNLTDGLDGLAILPTVLIAGALAVFAYVTGNVKFSVYLGIPYIRDASEVVVFCGALVGAGLGFLWFNAYPAALFMGGMGALALGATLAVVALMSFQWLLLPIIALIFVAEAGSVVIQVSYFKLSRRLTGAGQRVFKMTPLHLHFQLLGWSETQVTQRFWIIGVLAAMLGIALALL